MTYTEPIEDTYILDKDDELLGECTMYVCGVGIDRDISTWLRNITGFFLNL